LGLDYTENFTTDYVPADHRQNTGYIFFTKSIRMYILSNLYYHI